MTKCLRKDKVKDRTYWWLVEVHREGKKMVQKRLKYLGTKEPSPQYKTLLMQIDDERPMNDLYLIHKGGGGWYGHKLGEPFPSYGRRLLLKESDFFWLHLKADLRELIQRHVPAEHIYLVRASTGKANPQTGQVTGASVRYEAIKKAKQGEGIILPTLILEAELNHN